MKVSERVARMGKRASILGGISGERLLAGGKTEDGRFSAFK